MLLQFLTTHSATDFSVTSLWVCNILTEYTSLQKKSPVRSTRPHVNSSNHGVSVSQFNTTLNKLNNFFMCVNDDARKLKTTYSIICDIKWALFLLIYYKYGFLSLFCYCYCGTNTVSPSQPFHWCKIGLQKQTSSMAQSSSCQSTVVFCINFLFKFHMLLD